MKTINLNYKEKLTLKTCIVKEMQKLKDYIKLLEHITERENIDFETIINDHKEELKRLETLYSLIVLNRFVIELEKDNYL